MNIYDVIAKIKEDNRRLAFNYLSGGYKEMIESDEEKYLFDLLRHILGMSIHADKNDITLKPVITRDDGSHSFSLEDITEDDFGKLKALDTSKMPYEIALVIDLTLWNGKKCFDYARKAALLCEKNFEDTFDLEDWKECYDSIEMAIVIFSKLGDKENRKRCLDLVYKKVIELDGNDSGFLSIKLMKLLVDQKAKSYYLSLIPFIDKLLGTEYNNRTEDLFELKAKIFNKCGDQKEAQEVWCDYARMLEELVEKEDTPARHPLQKKELLSKALLLYQNNGKPEEAKRVSLAIQAVNKDVPESMCPVKKIITLPWSKEEMIALNNGLNFQEALILLYRLTYFRTKEEIEQEVLQSLKDKYLGVSMFSRVEVEEHGRTEMRIEPLDADNPKDNEELFEQHMFQNEKIYEDYIGKIFLALQLEYIRNLEFDVEDLQFLVQKNAVIPEGREKIIAEGLYWGLKGNIYLALHVLAPQMENIFRYIAESCNANVLKIGDTGIEEVSTLTSVFESPELRECLDENLLFIFEGMMNEKAGSNIRNLVAHGILEEGRADSGNSIYFFCAVLKFIFMYAFQNKPMYDNTLKRQVKR